MQRGCDGVLERVCHLSGVGERSRPQVGPSQCRLGCVCVCVLVCVCVCVNAFVCALRIGLSQLEGFRRHLLEVLQKSDKPKVISHTHTHTIELSPSPIDYIVCQRK